jgi:hypothetical protein
MRFFLLSTIVFMLFIVAGCNNDSGGEGITGPLGGGLGGGSGAVSFTVSLVQDPQTGEIYFEITPSTNVWVVSLRAASQAAQVDETFTVNDTAAGDDPLYLGPVADGILQQGQQWQFTIEGNIGNQQGQSFSVTSTFTV